VAYRGIQSQALPFWAPVPCLQRAPEPRLSHLTVAAVFLDRQKPASFFYLCPDLRGGGKCSLCSRCLSKAPRGSSPPSCSQDGRQRCRTPKVIWICSACQQGTPPHHPCELSELVLTLQARPHPLLALA
jgi:hypothetical protein